MPTSPPPHCRSDCPTLSIATADGFWARLRGLMFCRTPGPDDALLIPRCPSVHTFFMRGPIDLAYLDAEACVVKTVAGLRPWRVSVGGRRACQALEMAPGSLARHGLRPGVCVGARS